MNDRLVLAVPRSGLVALNSGFRASSGKDIFAMLDRAGLWLGPRSRLECDEGYLQVIPYVVLLRGSAVMTYRRSEAGAEGRLHGRMSVGVGGHIDLVDVVEHLGGVNVEATLERAARREVEEEVGAVDARARSWVGLLYDDSSSVGRVHIGVVALWQLEQLDVALGQDAAVTDGRLTELTDIDLEDVRWETWSRAVLAPLRRGQLAGGWSYGITARAGAG